jgi:hypothetical protein
MDGLTVDGDVLLQGNHDLHLVATNPNLGTTFQYGEITFGDSNLPQYVNHAKITSRGFYANQSSLEFHTSTNNSSPLRMNISNIGDICFYEDTGTTAKLCWDASAESLGIGTSSVDSLLTLDKDVSTAYDPTDDNAQRSSTNTLLLKNENGTTNSFAQIAFDLAGTGQSIARIVGINSGASTSDLAFVTEHSNTKSEKMRITSEGYVGIGTDSPSSSGGKLAVKTANAGYVVIEPTSSVTNQIATGIRLHGNANETDRYAGIFCYNGAANNVNSMTFWTTNSGSSEERMRITSAGHVLINTTALQGVGGLSLQVGGNNVVIENNTTSSAGNGTEYQVFRRNSSQIGSITMNGTTAVQYNTSSDYRLKENVVTEWDATSRLKQLKPSRFNFITEPDRIVDGFLAHEVQDIVPEAIAGEKDAVDAEGNPKYQGIDQSKLVPLLVKTIQELEARITALENQ